MIKCEDIAKEINEYDTPKIMNEKIEQIQKENDNLIKNKQDILNKLNKEEEKINTILNLLSELKGSFSENNNSNKANENIINNTDNINKNAK